MGPFGSSSSLPTRVDDFTPAKLTLSDGQYNAPSAVITPSASNMKRPSLFTLPLDILWEMTHYLDSLSLVNLGATCQNIRWFADAVLTRRHETLLIDKDCSITSQGKIWLDRLGISLDRHVEDIRLFFLSLCQSRKLATFAKKVIVLEYFYDLPEPFYLMLEWPVIQKALTAVVSPNSVFAGTVYPDLRKGRSVAFTFCTLLLLRSVEEITWLSPFFVTSHLPGLFTHLPQKYRSFSSLKSLSISIDSGPRDQFEDASHADHLWPVLVAPSLRQLEVVGLIQACSVFHGMMWQYYNPDYKVIRNYCARLDFSKNEPCHVSSIESLRLRHCHLATTYLQYLLRSFPALEVFEYINTYMDDLNQFDLEAFEYAMQPCSSRLKIFDWDIRKISEVSERERTRLVKTALTYRTGSLRAFSTLKRLGMPWYFLMGTRAGENEPSEERRGYESPPPIDEVLPPSLEVLVLRHCEYETDCLIASLLRLREDGVMRKLSGLRSICVQLYRDGNALLGRFDEIASVCKVNGIDFQIDGEYRPPERELEGSMGPIE